MAHKGGTIARNAKEFIEKETDTPVISKPNILNYQYIDEFKQINEDNNNISN